MASGWMRRAAIMHVTPADPSEVDDLASSFEAFVGAEATRFHGALRLLTRDRTEAEDLMQDAYLKVWERWHHVRSLEDPTGYLYRTAMNLHRKRRRRAAVAIRHAIRPRSPRDQLDEVELHDQVLRVLDAQPPAADEPRAPTGILHPSARGSRATHGCQGDHGPGPRLAGTGRPQSQHWRRRRCLIRSSSCARHAIGSRRRLMCSDGLERRRRHKENVKRVAAAAVAIVVALVGLGGWFVLERDTAPRPADRSRDLGTSRPSPGADRLRERWVRRRLRHWHLGRRPVRPRRHEGRGAASPMTSPRRW